MPIYEYQCRECGHRFEAIQKFSDAPITQCPECQQEAVSKLVSASAFRLRGTGWYETDFKTGNRRHGTQDADSKAADSKSGDSKSGDSKSGDSKSGSKSSTESSTGSGSKSSKPAA